MLTKLIYLMILICSFASVQATPLFLWDNQDGLVSANECQIIPTSKTKFKISKATKTKKEGLENLRTFGGFKQSYIVSGSLIKSADGRKKSNYNYIEVVGPVNHPTHKANKWFSERLDKGYLFNGSIDEVSKYHIKLESKTPVLKLIDDIELSSVSLKALYEDGQYQKLSCESLVQNRDYVVFGVHQDTANAPIAYIGVYWDETNIFRSISTSRQGSSDWKGSASINKQEPPVVEAVIKAEVMDEVVQEEGILEESTLAPISSIIPRVRPNIEGITITEGSNTMIVCMESGKLKVRNEELDTKIFSAHAFERVTLFNSWDESDTKIKKINDKDYEYIKVKFTEREAEDQQEGWVAKSYIQSVTDCPYKAPQVNIASVNKVESLDDPNCCIFPVKARTTADYTSHRVAKFGARRGGGSRLHAATDLYRFKNEPVVAVAPGRVIVGLKPFYFNSYYVVVKHVGGKVVRYGETTGQAVRGASAFNDQLSAGQKLGYVQQIITRKGNRLTPMLHFELYSGELTGDLSLSSRIPRNKVENYNSSYKRRKDLMDPTPYMQKWEKSMFGKSY